MHSFSYLYSVQYQLDVQDDDGLVYHPALWDQYEKTDEQARRNYELMEQNEGEDDDQTTPPGTP